MWESFDISVRIMAHKPSNPFFSALHHHLPRLHVWSGSTRTVLVWARTEGSQREDSGRQEHGANTAKKDEVLQRVREQPVMELQRIGERGSRGEQKNLKDL